MAQKRAKAEVCLVEIGQLQVEGLMLSDGTFGIAVPQVADLFGASRNTLSRDLKRLMGEDFRPSKQATELGNQSINFIDLKTFELILLKLDRAGNQKAQDFRNDLVGLSLHQLFCDSFGIQFEKKERVNWWKIRRAGVGARRTCTDALQDWLAHYQPRLTESQLGFRYAEVTDAIYLGLFGRTAQQLKVDWSCKNPRDAMEEKELKYLETIEALFTRILDNNGHRLTPVQAVEEALARLEIPIQTR